MSESVIQHGADLAGSSPGGNCVLEPGQGEEEEEEEFTPHQQSGSRRLLHSLDVVMGHWIQRGFTYIYF